MHVFLIGESRSFSAFMQFLLSFGFFKQKVFLGRLLKTDFSFTGYFDTFLG